MKSIITAALMTLLAAGAARATQVCENIPGWGTFCFEEVDQSIVQTSNNPSNTQTATNTASVQQ